MSMFTWYEFIQLSEGLIAPELCNKVTDECVYRVIISRSYYGIFKQIDDFLFKKKNLSLPQIDDKKKPLGSHERIIQYLVKQPDVNIQYIGGILKELKDNRYVADYKLRPIKGKAIDKNLAEQVISKAKEINKLWNEEKIKLFI